MKSKSILISKIISHFAFIFQKSFFTATGTKACFTLNTLNIYISLSASKNKKNIEVMIY